MGIKSDKWIRTMSKEFEMITPFSEKQVREGIVSYELAVTDMTLELVMSL